jgi:hypothetical protein
MGVSQEGAASAPRIVAGTKRESLQRPPGLDAAVSAEMSGEGDLGAGEINVSQHPVVEAHHLVHAAANTVLSRQRTEASAKKACVAAAAIDLR